LLISRPKKEGKQKKKQRRNGGKAGKKKGGLEIPYLAKERHAFQNEKKSREGEKRTLPGK